MNLLRLFFAGIWWVVSIVAVINSFMYAITEAPGIPVFIVCTISLINLIHAASKNTTKSR